jgi:hypothetical protein
VFNRHIVAAACCHLQATARKEGLTGVQFKDVAGLGPILNEVLEVVEVGGCAQLVAELKYPSLASGCTCSRVHEVLGMSSMGGVLTMGRLSGSGRCICSTHTPQPHALQLVKTAYDCMLALVSKRALFSSILRCSS